MPEKKTLERAATAHRPRSAALNNSETLPQPPRGARPLCASSLKDKREGKAASTQAGEFVREEMEHVREGKHGVASRKQAIAIGLSKARKAGIDLKAPPQDKAKPKVKGHRTRIR